MKTLKLLFVFTIISTACLNLTAQEYFNETSKWMWVDFGRKVYYADYGYEDNFHQLKAIEEVELNGQTYMQFEHVTKILHYEWSNELFSFILDHTSINERDIHMRQDGRKLFILDQDGETLHNYELEVGDTLYRSNNNQPQAAGIVDSIYNVPFNGQSRKAFIIDQIVFPQAKYLIFEGIGSDEGLFDLQSHNFEESSYLICYEMDDESFPVYHFDDTVQGNVEVSCDAFTVHATDLLEERLQVYPIPTADKIHINLESNRTISKISVNSLDGSLHDVTFVVNNKGLEIDVSHLPSGTYILQLINEERRFTKKFVKI